MIKFKYLLCAPLLSVVLACSDDSPKNETSDTDPGTTVSVEKVIKIDVGQTFQTITGFGASDCWSPAYVGKYWTTNRDKISELLFSTEIQSGDPQGIGLSMWRVNLGGGSAEQGDASGLVDKSRRAESYLTDNLTLDWMRCEGQRYFLNRAKEFGCESVVLFSNTPPVQYTYNGKGFSARGGVSNLKSEHYDDFAAYMSDVAQHYVNLGYPVTHISPVNEPQYNWDSGQEGSGWTNDEVALLTRELNGSLTSRNLSTNILLGESGDWEYLYKTKNDANRSNVLSAFFDPASSAYVGGLTHLEKLICGHSYWTDGTWDGMRDVRSKVAQAAQQYDIDVWQSEWSMLGDGYSSSEFVGYDAASEMDIALYMSKVIHNDLTVAGVSSWSYWTSMDVSRWGHKNRFLLISLVPSGGVDGDIQQEGTFQATPTLWVLGNYSRFIRPGYRRVSIELNESRSFFASAWISPTSDKIVIVYTNLSDKGVRLNETHVGWKSDVKSINTYTTTGSKSLLEGSVTVGQPVVLDAQSVTTVVYNL
ncbi:glycoside hydrolase [Bacteroides ihuae]|uniref:glycoside hydrolase n=1 Tax=Bacteroides ihuae TaxID=1852362 RepID=UPI0008D93D99|nr:glycoside hydrolase [Bacteroides ihuae]